MKAILKAARITPKKANLIAGMVRTRPASESLKILKFTPKKAAQLLHKLLLSAVSNAVSNFKQDETSLTVKEIIVTKGPTLKRGVPVSRGRVYPVLKRTSNITIILEVNEKASPVKAGKKAEPAAAKETAGETAAAPAKNTAKTTKTVKKPRKTSK
jgi:large subunit ribosomal protein L22